MGLESSCVSYFQTATETMWMSGEKEGTQQEASAWRGEREGCGEIQHVDVQVEQNKPGDTHSKKSQNQIGTSSQNTHCMEQSLFVMKKCFEMQIQVQVN
jgi:hypothetical protein